MPEKNRRQPVKNSHPTHHRPLKRIELKSYDESNSDSATYPCLARFLSPVKAIEEPDLMVFGASPAANDSPYILIMKRIIELSTVLDLPLCDFDQT